MSQNAEDGEIVSIVENEELGSVVEELISGVKVSVVEVEREELAGEAVQRGCRI